MKVSRKAAACICAMMMATSSAAAFSVNAADSESQDVSASQTAEGSGSVKIGKVTEIDGSRLTVALGEFSGKKASAEALSDMRCIPFLMRKKTDQDRHGNPSDPHQNDPEPPFIIHVGQKIAPSELQAVDHKNGRVT